jgi:cation diffusion facilitator family transporter
MGQAGKGGKGSGETGGKGSAETGGKGSGETRKTVLAAGAANVAIAVTKLIAGLVAGSSAMLAEAAHSIADTLNQGFLLASLRRSTRPADARHPFGYGQERYFWSLLAAVGIFVAGACYSIIEGVLTIVSPEEHGDPTIAFVVLAVACVAEGASLGRAVHQVRNEARECGRTLPDHIRRSPDLTVKAALFEDSAAMVGLAFAAAGLTLRQLTGASFWDGAASIAIGMLLVVVAWKLGRNSMILLIGRAVDGETQDRIRAEIDAIDGVDSVLELLTMHLGPDELLVAARISFDGELSASDAERVADRIDQRLRDSVSIVRHVFVDPTRREREPVHGGGRPDR